MEFSTLTRALATLESYIPILTTCSVQKTWLHGDFQLGNILFSEHDVFGLDMAYSSEGIAMTDAAHFLNCVQRYILLPKGLHLLGARRKVTEAFVDAYLGKNAGVDGIVLSWFRAVDDIKFLAQFYRRTQTPHRRWYFRKIQELAVADSLKRLQSAVKAA
jgi:thiamine kinase-like enzyme